MEDGEIRARAAALLAGGLSDEEALARVVRLLHDARPAWDWVGVYLLAGEELVLGPYAGAPTTHTRIPVGRGVCGTAVATGENQVIADVGELDNYLACSASTRSRSWCSSATTARWWVSSTWTPTSRQPSALTTRPCSRNWPGWPPPAVRRWPGR